MDILYIAVIVCLLSRVLFLETQYKDLVDKFQTLYNDIKDDHDSLKPSIGILEEMRLIHEEIKGLERISDEQIKDYIVQFDKLIIKINQIGFNRTYASRLNNNLTWLIEYAELKRSYTLKLDNLKGTHV